MAKTAAEKASKPAKPAKADTATKAKAPKAEKATKPTAKRSGGALAKPVTPSAELAAIVGPHPIPRTAVVSKVWDHIREHKLQDPENRRSIIADDKLRVIFGKERATMFELSGLLSAHLTSVA